MTFKISVAVTSRASAPGVQVRLPPPGGAAKSRGKSWSWRWCARAAGCAVHCVAPRPYICILYLSRLCPSSGMCRPPPPGPSRCGVRLQSLLLITTIRPDTGYGRCAAQLQHCTRVQHTWGGLYALASSHSETGPLGGCGQCADTTGLRAQSCNTGPSAVERASESCNTITSMPQTHCMSLIFEPRFLLEFVTAPVRRRARRRLAHSCACRTRAGRRALRRWR